MVSKPIIANPSRAMPLKLDPLERTNIMRSFIFTRVLPAGTLGLLALAWSVSQAAEAPAKGRPATIELTVPADAQVTFDGVETKQRGNVRLFVTPPLDPQLQHATYAIRVWGTTNGVKFDDTIHIPVREGDHIRITDPKGFAPSASNSAGPQPPPARSNVYTFGPDGGGRMVHYFTDHGAPAKVRTLSEMDPMRGSGPPGFRGGYPWP
jgi:uncharacterized protein (TIGR03000 family)